MAIAPSPREPQVPGGPWRTFVGGSWQNRIDVREFIQRNYTPYAGDERFLAGPTERTTRLWQKLAPLLAEERAQGGGLQTEAPLTGAIMPFGGWRVVEASLRAYGIEPDARIAEIFTKYPPRSGA